MYFENFSREVLIWYCCLVAIMKKVRTASAVF